MKATKYFILFFIIILILSSCLQKTIYLNQNPEESKFLTLTSIPSNFDTFRICVNMSDGVGFVDSADVFITDATVEIYDENMNLIEQLAFDTASLIDYPMYKSHIIPEIGKKYIIKATYQDKTASASFIIPEPVKILGAEVKPENIDTNFWYRYNYQITVTIKDPDTANAYTAIGYFNAKYYVYNYVNDTTYDSTLVQGRILINMLYNDQTDEFDINSDPIPYASYIQLDHFHYGPIVEDLSFNGQTAELTFGFLLAGNYIDWDSTITFVLFTIPDETYQYYKTLQLFQAYRNNPFVEPVNVYTNVENGFGAVVPLSADTVRVRIPSVK